MGVIGINLATVSFPRKRSPKRVLEARSKPHAVFPPGPYLLSPPAQGYAAVCAGVSVPRAERLEKPDPLGKLEKATESYLYKWEKEMLRFHGPGKYLVTGVDSRSPSFFFFFLTVQLQLSPFPPAAEVCPHQQCPEV